jgi:hypothetical protein
MVGVVTAVGEGTTRGNVAKTTVGVKGRGDEFAICELNEDQTIKHIRKLGKMNKNVPHPMTDSCTYRGVVSELALRRGLAAGLVRDSARAVPQ